MDGVPGQLFPDRPSSAAQIRSRAMPLSPPSALPSSAPRPSALAPRPLRHASRTRRSESTSVIGAENASPSGAGRKLKFADVLRIFARLLANKEIRAVVCLVEELASSDMAQYEFQTTLVMFNRELVDFVNKHSSELSTRASECIQHGGQKEANTKTEVEVGMRTTKDAESAVSMRSGPSPDPVPDRASDSIKRGGQEAFSTKPKVEAGTRATRHDQSTASIRSASDAGGSMRRSVLHLCRHARNLTRRATGVTSFNSVSEQENREAFPFEHRSARSKTSPSGTDSRASHRYSCAIIMIEASNRQRQARGQSYDGVVPNERSTFLHDR